MNFFHLQCFVPIMLLLRSSMGMEYAGVNAEQLAANGITEDQVASCMNVVQMMYSSGGVYPGVYPGGPGSVYPGGVYPTAPEAEAPTQPPPTTTPKPCHSDDCLPQAEVGQDTGNNPSSQSTWTMKQNLEQIMSFYTTPGQGLDYSHNCNEYNGKLSCWGWTPDKHVTWLGDFFDRAFGMKIDELFPNRPGDEITSTKAEDKLHEIVNERTKQLVWKFVLAVPKDVELTKTSVKCHENDIQQSTDGKFCPIGWLTYHLIKDSTRDLVFKEFKNRYDGLRQYETTFMEYGRRRVEAPVIRRFGELSVAQRN